MCPFSLIESSTEPQFALGMTIKMLTWLQSICEVTTNIPTENLYSKITLEGEFEYFIEILALIVGVQTNQS